ncbi:transglutaminase-like cysteine peptidase [Roseibium sp. SCP14]|uniref:transglutaminase-like cysteine peptidase n=1 Tax=Roseibium sp. SCP14 TaxID=3141375 RepID=UPI00333BAFCA
MTNPSVFRRLTFICTVSTAILFTSQNGVVAADGSTLGLLDGVEIASDKSRSMSLDASDRAFPDIRDKGAVRQLALLKGGLVSSDRHSRPRRAIRTAAVARHTILKFYRERVQREDDTPKADRGSATSFFGTAAIRFSNIGSAREWGRVRGKRIDGASADLCLSAACRKRADRVSSFAAKVEGKSFFVKLQTANALVNRVIAYQEDQVTYRRLDYWATSAETTRRGVGDCEDFAILKYNLLLAAGVPEKSMSLVVLKDMKRDLYHAVLAVSTNKGHYILDNVVNRVYLDRENSHYQPLYSFSADRSWLHGKPVGNAPRRTVSFQKVAPGISQADDFELTASEAQGKGTARIFPVVRD